VCNYVIFIHVPTINKALNIENVIVIDFPLYSPVRSRVSQSDSASSPVPSRVSQSVRISSSVRSRVSQSDRASSPIRSRVSQFVRASFACS
jgi:hypothetical protein